MTLRELRENPMYMDLLGMSTMYKRILEGMYRDYAWERDFAIAEVRNDLEKYSDWLDMTVGDIYMENGEIMQVDLVDE